MQLTIKTFLLLVLASFASKLHAQFEGNNWYFADSAAVSFNNDMLTYIDGSPMLTSEGCATISDACGNLLFFTNGELVYDKAGNVMPNGTGMLGHQSSTQSSLIVPKPETPNIFYVFTNDARERELKNGLCYSIVDMTLNAGMGDVLVAEKNTELLNPATEKLTAVRHSNGVDIWVVAHRYYSNQFYSFLVTKNGISAPVITSVGTIHQDQGVDFNANSVGAMKLSPDGTKIALALFEESKAELLDFNSTTGVVSNSRILPIGKPKTFGIGWSPNSQMLYVTSEFDIFQFDATAADVAGSKVNVYSDFARQVRGLQVAFDEKLYIARFNNPFLDVINKPNLKGSACNVQVNAFSLGDDFSKACFPSFIQSYFDEKQKPQIIIDKNCTDSIINFELNSYVDVDSVKWNFGDPFSGPSNLSNSNKPSHNYGTKGEYNITLRVYKNCPQPIVIRRTIEIANVPIIDLGNDTAICVGTSLFLGKLNDEFTSLWSTGDTTDTITVVDSNSYSVILNNVCEEVYDTILIVHKDIPVVNIQGDTEMCVNASQKLIAIAKDAKTYEWLSASNETDSFLDINFEGTYWVEVTNDCGLDRDTIIIEPIELPKVKLPDDTLVCTVFEKVLTVESEKAEYRWSTGDTTRSIVVDVEGKYWVDVYACNKRATDTIYIDQWGEILNLTPTAFSPNEDHLNDSFGPVLSFTDGDTNYRFMIYDRWGIKVFETLDILLKWDGTYEGKLAEEGMYLYLVTFRGCDGKKRRLHGTFFLVR